MSIYNQLVQRYLDYEILYTKESISTFLNLENYIKEITFSSTSRFKNLWLSFSKLFFGNFIILSTAEEAGQITYYYLNNRIFNKVKPSIETRSGSVYKCFISPSYHKTLCEATNTLH